MDREMWATRGRYALAATLGLTILGLTYVLFDPDLGTPVPLFQEFTCTSRYAVTALNGYGEPVLRAPQSGLISTASDRGDTKPTYFVVHRREEGGDWQRYLEASSERGEQTFVLSNLLPSTEAYVQAFSLDGRTCAGRSGVLRVAAEPADPGPTPTSSEPAPGSP